MLPQANKRASMSLSPPPPKVLAQIVGLANAAEGTRALDALCHTNRDTYQVCQIPFLQRDQLEPSLQSFLPNAPSRTAQGNLVSPLQVLEASKHLQQMTVCVRYALYSAMVIATRSDPSIGMKGPLLTFDEFARQDGLAPRDHLFAPIIPHDHLVLYPLSDGSVERSFVFRLVRVKDQRCVAPDAGTRALINRALAQAAIEAVIDTDSAEQTPAMCASIDLFAVYPQLSVCVTPADFRQPTHMGSYIRSEMEVDLYPIFHNGQSRPAPPPPRPADVAERLQLAMDLTYRPIMTREEAFTRLITTPATYEGADRLTQMIAGALAQMDMEEDIYGWSVPDLAEEEEAYIDSIVRDVSRDIFRSNQTP